MGGKTRRGDASGASPRSHNPSEAVSFTPLLGKSNRRSQKRHISDRRGPAVSQKRHIMDTAARPIEQGFLSQKIHTQIARRRISGWLRVAAFTQTTHQSRVGTAGLRQLARWGRTLGAVGPRARTVESDRAVVAFTQRPVHRTKEQALIFSPWSSRADTRTCRAGKRTGRQAHHRGRLHVGPAARPEAGSRLPQSISQDPSAGGSGWRE